MAIFRAWLQMADENENYFLPFVCPPPTASGHGSKEHGYHRCTRIGHSRILRPIILGFKSAFGAILKDFGEQARLVVSVHPRVTRSVQKSFKIAPKALLNPNVIGLKIRE